MSPRTLPGSRDAAGTRQAVIEAALDAIHRFGYRNASSNRIAQHAGVTWGVIQYHFGTAEGLLLAVLRAAIDDVEARIDAIDATLPGRTFDERFDAWESLVLESFGYPRFPAIVQIAMDLGRDPSAADDTIAELDRYQSTILRLVDLAAQLGGERPLSPILADYVYWSSWSVALAEAMDVYLRDRPDPQAPARRAALRTAMKAIVAANPTWPVSPRAEDSRER